MSGHSKWNTIKRKKGANDAARAKEFTKIARMITVAAQNGGGDISMNPSLALAVDKAKSINMPNDNIERAIKRGTGESNSGSRLEEISYEAYGPCNVALIIDTTTDNRNRTVGELRSAVEKHGGIFADNGAVSWQFKTLGRILIEFETEEEKKTRENAKWSDKDKLEKINLPREKAEEFELELYDINGILSVEIDESGIEIKTEYTDLNNARKFIQEKGIKISDAGLIKESNTRIKLNDEEIERLEKFLEAIEELDDVQQIWTNIE